MPMIHIISPHLDDAVISLGGLLLKLKTSGESPCLHYLFNNPQSCKAASQHEREICESLGSRSYFYNFPHAEEREDLSADSALTIQIEKQLTLAMDKEKDHVLFPLGLEDPDHQAAREIGVSMFYNGYKTFFYEDMPNAIYYDYSVLTPMANRKGFDAECVSIDMEQKLSLAKLFDNVELDCLKDLKNYAYNLDDNTFYERLWKPKGFVSNFTSPSK
jgi:hypothetical protein